MASVGRFLVIDLTVFGADEAVKYLQGFCLAE